ncbi:MAG: hypothetical protein OES32_02785 [Acidobacteriota bacterium]|nr:hypothetical protein [Acidobacteriota bacterium]MDH3522488.1 hypothetical protein [Acidobacteriota bacterium]
MTKSTRAVRAVALALAVAGAGAAQGRVLSVAAAASPCLNLRSAPSAAATAASCWPPGTRLLALEAGPEWTRVEVADGRRGWMASRFLVTGGQAAAAGASRAVAPPGIELEAALAAGKLPALGGILYDQTDSPAGAGFVSQLFEPANSAFDCRAADDFTVPAADVQWDVVEVAVLGGYLQGPGLTPLLDLELFPDGGGVPGGAAACSYLGLVAGVDFVDDGAGNLVVTLPATCSLPAGDYWLSVRADMDLATGGQWLWAERAVQSGATFAWENPPDGFGTGCVAWTPANACGASAPDLLFALVGSLVPVELQSIRVD